MSVKWVGVGSRCELVKPNRTAHPKSVFCWRVIGIITPNFILINKTQRNCSTFYCSMQMQQKVYKYRIAWNFLDTLISRLSRFKRNREIKVARTISAASITWREKYVNNQERMSLLQEILQEQVRRNVVFGRSPKASGS